MGFVGNFKLLACWALCLVVCIQAHSVPESVSVNQIGDISIENKNGKWTCDQIECPEGTYKCYVLKTNEKDASILVRTDICYSRYDQTLARKSTSTPVNPKEKIRVEIESFGNGTIIINDNGKIFNSQKFKKDLEKKLQGIDTNVSNEMKHLQKNLDNMSNSLSHMFD